MSSWSEQREQHDEQRDADEHRNDLQRDAAEPSTRRRSPRCGDGSPRRTDRVVFRGVRGPEHHQSGDGGNDAENQSDHDTLCGTASALVQDGLVDVGAR